MKQLFGILSAILLGVAAQLGDAQAQSQFSPAIKVGNGIVTFYQIEQRALFLTLLNAPGDTTDLAREQLVTEVIQTTAAADAGVAVDPNAVESGLTEFASRAELTVEEFETALIQSGVDPMTWRDLITAGITWRLFVQDQFVRDARDSIPDPLINRTLARTGTPGGTRYLLSEVLLPATTPETIAASMARAREIAALTDETAFASAARRFSISPTRANGGERPWVAEDVLPPNVVGTVSALSTGQISQPLLLEGVGIILYLMRDREVIAAGAPEDLDVDYAVLVTGADTGSAASIRNRIDRCDDLFGVAQGLPENRLTRDSQVLRTLPANLRLALSTLDINEATILPSQDGQERLLMLCNRTASTKSDVDQNLVGTRLLNSRLNVSAENALAELRARTPIIDLSQ